MKLGDMPAVDMGLLNADDAHTLGPSSLLEPLMDKVSQNHWLPVACIQREFTSPTPLHSPQRYCLRSEAMLRENGDTEMDLHQQLAVQQRLASRDLADLRPTAHG